MNKLATSLGLTDGEHVSSQRVISFIIIGCWMATKLWANLKAATPMTFDNAEVGLVASVLGAGVLKNAAENTNISIGQPKTP